MAKQIARRRGTASQHGSFIGTAGEITIDTTNNRPVIHDGSTPGGLTGVMRNDIFTLGNPVLKDIAGNNRFESFGGWTAVNDPNGINRFYTDISTAQILGTNEGTIFSATNLNISSGVIYITTGQCLYNDPNGNNLMTLASGNILLGQPSRISTSTVGFPYIPMITGVPTTNPTTYNGFCPIAINTGSMKLFLHNPTGKWWSVQLISQ